MATIKFTYASSSSITNQELFRTHEFTASVDLKNSGISCPLQVPNAYSQEIYSDNLSNTLTYYAYKCLNIFMNCVIHPLIKNPLTLWVAANLGNTCAQKILAAKTRVSTLPDEQQPKGILHSTAILSSNPHKFKVHVVNISSLAALNRLSAPHGEIDPERTVILNFACCENRSGWKIPGLERITRWAFGAWGSARQGGDWENWLNASGHEEMLMRETTLSATDGYHNKAYRELLGRDWIFHNDMTSLNFSNISLLPHAEKEFPHLKGKKLHISSVCPVDLRVSSWQRWRYIHQGKFVPHMPSVTLNAAIGTMFTYAEEKNLNAAVLDISGAMTFNHDVREVAAAMAQALKAASVEHVILPMPLEDKERRAEFLSAFVAVLNQGEKEG